MFEFDEKDYINQKALAKKIISLLAIPCEKIEKQCLLLCTEVSELEKKLENSKSDKEINLYSKKLELKNESLIKFLAIKERLNKIVKRNQDRIKYFDAILSKMGIYSEKPNSAELAEIEKQELFNISESSLNLNSANEGKDKFKFFAGERFLFNGSSINFSDEQNIQKIINLNQKEIHDLVFNYPKSIPTVTAEMLVNNKFKQNLLKEITVFVSEQSKKHNFKEINAMLGGLLSFKSQITESVDSYIAGVQNLFNVMIKNFLMQKYPNSANEIAKKLKCNAKSELIPSRVRETLLAGGILDLVSEEKISEEERKELESEANSAEIAKNLSNKFHEQDSEKEKRKNEEIKKTEAENFENNGDEIELDSDLEAFLSMFKGDDDEWKVVI